MNVYVCIYMYVFPGIRVHVYACYIHVYICPRQYNMALKTQIFFSIWYGTLNISLCKQIYFCILYVRFDG